MQKVYQRIRKKHFQIILILVVIITDFRWARVLKTLLKNSPELVGKFSPADQSQLISLIEHSINTGVFLALLFQASLFFILVRWGGYFRIYFLVYCSISILLLLWNCIYDYSALIFLSGHLFVFYGLYYWKIIYESSEQESLFATAKSNQAKGHSHS